MNVLIIEDERLAADKLEQTLQEIDPSIRVMDKLGSVKESVQWLMQHAADLIFLDIQLSDGISFSIFEQVTVTTPVIFTTAYDQYAVKAFQLNSISYLLKPIRKNELAESLQKYKSLKSAFSIDFDALVAHIQGREPDYKKRFLIQIGERIRKIEVSEISRGSSKELVMFDGTIFGLLNMQRILKWYLLVWPAFVIPGDGSLDCFEVHEIKRVFKSNSFAQWHPAFSSEGRSVFCKTISLFPKGRHIIETPGQTGV